MGFARVGGIAAVRRQHFEESDYTRLARGLDSGGTGRICVLARRAFGVGCAQVSHSATLRRERFEKASRTCLARGLSSGGTGGIRVFASRTLGVGSTLGIETTYFCVTVMHSF